MVIPVARMGKAVVTVMFVAAAACGSFTDTLPTTADYLVDGSAGGSGGMTNLDAGITKGPARAVECVPSTTRCAGADNRHWQACNREQRWQPVHACQERCDDQRGCLCPRGQRDVHGDGTVCDATATLAPVLQMVAPTDRAQGVADSTVLAMRFSVAMDCGALAQHLIITPFRAVNTTTLRCNSPAPGDVTFLPQPRFSEGDAVRWVIGRDAVSRDGTPLGTTLEGSFTIARDEPETLYALPLLSGALSPAVTDLTRGDPLPLGHTVDAHHRVILTFDLGKLPATALRIKSAQLRVVPVAGGAVVPLTLDHIAPGSVIDVTAFDVPPAGLPFPDGATMARFMPETIG